MPQCQMPRLAQVFDGPSTPSPVSLIPPVNQPDQARYARLQSPRFIVEPPKRLEGPPVHESYIFAIGQPQIRLKYQIPRPRAPIDVPAPASPQTDVFAISQPDQARYARLQAPRFQVAAPPRVHEGAAIVAPQTYVFPLPQPELRWWLRFDVNRTPNGPVAQVTGAFNQLTLALSGVSATGTAGDLGTSHSVAVTGATATGAVGSVHVAGTAVPNLIRMLDGTTTTTDMVSEAATSPNITGEGDGTDSD